MSPSKSETRAFLDVGHDHRHCVADALGRAEALCAVRGARLTKLRRRVFELIWASHAPVGAYDVLRRLSEEHAPAAPPTVYRAIEFLLEQGLIHRIESLNAFVGCCDPAEEQHSGQFLICEICGCTAELLDPKISRAIEQSASRAGFAVTSSTVEVRGICPGCQNGACKNGSPQNGRASRG